MHTRTVAITEQPSLGYTTPALVVPSPPLRDIRGNLSQGFPPLRFILLHKASPTSSLCCESQALCIYPFALHHWRIDVLLAHKRRPGSSSPSPPPPPTAVVHGSTTMSFCLPTVRIIVTCNAERYQVVDITGATNGSFIRERVLSKLCIPDDRYSRFRVYQAQVGTYALGSALSDAMLFEICLQQGDPSGSLTFFVSTAPDRPPKPTEPDYSDTYLYSQSVEIESISDSSVGTSFVAVYYRACKIGL
ncbi:uncharacterized protein BT62DRAFT_923317 [Guyanagaster necrorhizus]|uniref:Ras-binding domain-containing protein n=1 Tax=Guyanagaster necrorhizus TaxID=856835 RepID=A0A9P7VJC2_9AGAR|nr:uncharacterized protein BT62DRAFT_923317 [Guyanagaster necrorhizus MCA 3950]KAG7441552.1 hypothetical protein BT62DRAFT_923317 [Guyanagaster necrorhizus MCA 3950]